MQLSQRGGALRLPQRLDVRDILRLRFRGVGRIAVLGRCEWWMYPLGLHTMLLNPALVREDLSPNCVLVRGERAAGWDCLAEIGWYSRRR